MKININSPVTVELTPAGQARWRGLYGMTPSVKVSLQLWELMHIFGPGMTMGMLEMYFVDNEIEL